MSKTIQCDVAVLGAGPGGYTAAFRAADLGKKVVLIDKASNLGGVCLNVGCIPSKALLHVAKVLDETQHLGPCGVSFAKPAIDNDKLRRWKNQVISRLTTGLASLAKKRHITILTGEGQLSSSQQIEVSIKGLKHHVNFDHAIIAAGSRPVTLPFIPKDWRIMDSTAALEIKKTDGELLIIGGGIIGLEMATVYHALGAKIHVVEVANQLMPGADKDIVMPLYKRLTQHYNIMLETKVTKVEAKKEGIYVTFDHQGTITTQKFDQVLVAVGRMPNGKLIGADKAGIAVDERGFIHVDKQLRTNVSHIFAIGDIVGQPMLAHKAHGEAVIAAEVIAGQKHYFDPRCIPSVAYTDPEVAWVGMTENQARKQAIKVAKGVFPWMASGRSLAMNRDEGITKVLFDQKSNRVIGAGIVGPNAGELIAELALAIEMACDAKDIALTIHPHPTLSETIALATEAFDGSITDLYMPKK